MSQKRIAGAILALCLLVLVPAVPAVAQGTVAPVARQTWFTNSGDPAAGYWICVYAAGTSTLATTYTTSALSVANSNPLVLDSAGRGTVFLSPGQSYKFVLKSPTTPVNCTTGTTIWSVDNVNTIPAANVTVDVDGVAGESLASGDTVYLSDGSGAKNAGQWYLADADLTYGSTSPEIGITVAAIASGATGSIRIQGRSTNLSGLTMGSAYYVSATAGALTATAPTNARYVGQADTTTSLVTTPNPPPNNSMLSAVIDPKIKTLSEGRLSLTTGVPVTTADVTAATTLYWVPYEGNNIALYSGSAWVMFSQAQLSIALPAAASQMYDVFVDYNSGTPALSLLAWTNDTTRATALTTQDGVYVLTGSTGKRYVGSVRTTAVAGQSEDSIAKRYVWNYYHRVPRDLQLFVATNSWTYTTSTWRQANGSTANQVAFIVGVAEVRLEIQFGALVQNNTGAVAVGSAIGLDTTSAVSSGQRPAVVQIFGAAEIVNNVGTYASYPAVGYHFAALLERSAATGTTTWYSNSSLFSFGEQTGFKGWIQG